MRDLAYIAGMAPAARAASVEVSIVHPIHFIEASRDSGYRDLATALAELVDNAVDANAREIEISIENTGRDQPDFRVMILDNGVGVSRRRLASALQFGGTHRFNSRSGIGRYGMGLPNASLSHARRVELYSWENGRPARRALLDLDRILAGFDRGLQIQGRIALPTCLHQYRRRYNTAIVWTRCDRITCAQLPVVERRLRLKLGRLFRGIIETGVVLRLNGETVEPIDPTRIFPRPDGLTVELLPRLDVSFRSNTATTPAIVSVQFAVLPIEEWSCLPNRVKRRYGIIKSSGVSVVRQGREIASGWFFLEDKRKENYDDWWRCEISFPAILDDAFGVTNTKQGIRPSADLIDALAPIITGQAKELNRAIRQRFEAMKDTRCVAERRAQSRDNFLAAPISSPPPSAGETKLASRAREYRLRFENCAARPLLRCVTKRNITTIHLNKLHPFYTQLYVPILAQHHARCSTALNAFVLALGRAIGELGHQGNTDFVNDLSDTCAAFLRVR